MTFYLKYSLVIPEIVNLMSSNEYLLKFNVSSLQICYFTFAHLEHFIFMLLFLMKSPRLHSRYRIFI